ARGAPPRAPEPVRRRAPPPDELRRRGGRARRRGHRGHRHRPRRPAGRHLPRVGRRRPARQQDRLGRAHHPPADGHRRAVPERALADTEPRDRDVDAALQARRARRARAPGGDRAREGRGAGRQLRLADPLLRPAPVHDGEGPPHQPRGRQRDRGPRRRPRRLRPRLAARQRRPRQLVEPDEQPSAPYLDAVVAYGFRGSGRFHVPGHKGGPGADPGLRFALGDRALALDIPQDIRGIDLGPSPTPYERAEALAAEAYGAQRTWFLTNGATQGNHALALALAPTGTCVVAQRNSHASLIDGLVISGGTPAFVSPEYDDELGMAHGVTPDALRSALQSRPDAAAAFVVSPTYYGMAADVAGCAEVAHAAGVPLVVDQAWGPHFGFHPDLPPGALSEGADAVLTSTHKIVGSLTQSAMLHVAGTGRIDPAAVARAVRLVRSTSPSSPLPGSLAAARRQLAVH